MYMTRSGCWLIDERMGTGDVGEDKPRKNWVYLASHMQDEIFYQALKCSYKTSWHKLKQYIKVRGLNGNRKWY